jgi:hypothetical protein
MYAVSKLIKEHYRQITDDTDNDQEAQDVAEELNRREKKK